MSTDNPISRTEYDEHIAAASSNGNYFLFRESYLEIMSRDAALVIQKFINKYGYLQKRGKLKDPQKRITYSVEALEKALKMKKDAQLRVLDELQGFYRTYYMPQRAFIKVSREGWPPKRYIRINFLLLNRALSDPESIPPFPNQNAKPRFDSKKVKTRNPADTKRETPLLTVLNQNNELTSCQPYGHDSVNGVLIHENGKVTSFSEKCAKFLYKLLTKKQMLKRWYKVPPIGKWSKSFRELLKIRQKEKIWEVLQRYAKNFGHKYLVVACSAKRFCEEFVRIEDNLDRIEEVGNYKYVDSDREKVC